MRDTRDRPYRDQPYHDKSLPPKPPGKQVSIRLSMDAFSYLGGDSSGPDVWPRKRVRWSKYFVLSDRYIDERTQVARQLGCMFEPDDSERRPRMTTMWMTDWQQMQLVDLALRLDLSGEPRLHINGQINIGRLASVVLEAIAFGYLRIENFDYVGGTNKPKPYAWSPND